MTMKNCRSDRGGASMINKDLFDMANETNNAELKALLREAFLTWCKVNGRSPMNAKSIQDWWKVEVTEK